MNELKIKALSLALKGYPNLVKRIIKNPNRYNISFHFDIRTYDVRVKLRVLKGLIVDNYVQVRDLKQVMEVNLDDLKQL